MSNIVETLTEMGFSRERAEQAVKETSSNDLQIVMDWLLTHEESVVEPNSVNHQQDPPLIQQNADNETNSDVQSESNVASSEIVATVAKSIKCDDCGKLFKTNEEVEYHATKSGHQSFSESTEEKRPLTDEEKKEQLAKIEEKLKQRRLEREAKEKDEALLKEKNRIKSGKELLEVKKRREEVEMKKIIDQRKKEKEEEKLARQKIKEQIEQDKLARKAKFGNQTEVVAPVITPVNLPPVKPQMNYSEVKLQIRMQDGSSLTQTFGAKEPLSVVRLFINMKRSSPEDSYSLMTSFPKKVFESEDYDKPLDSLGLAPTAVLIVKKN